MGHGGTNIGKDVQRFASYIVAAVLAVVFLISIAEDAMAVLGFGNAGVHVESVVRPTTSSSLAVPKENRKLSSELSSLATSSDGNDFVPSSFPFAANTDDESKSRTSSRNRRLRGIQQLTP